MEHFGKSYGWVATGAEVRDYGGQLRLIWGHSNSPVDVTDGGLFKPWNGKYHWDLKSSHFLFLEPVNHYGSSSSSYLQDVPTEHIKPWLYSDSSYEFVCMKDGKYY